VMNAVVRSHLGTLLDDASSSRGRAVAAQHERSHLTAASSVAASAGKPDMSPGSRLARLVLHTWPPGSRTRHGAPELAPLRPS
jgi:hypothetical protein